MMNGAPNGWAAASVRAPTSTANPTAMSSQAPVASCGARTEERGAMAIPTVLDRLRFGVRDDRIVWARLYMDHIERTGEATAQPTGEAAGTDRAAATRPSDRP
jgi:hypothetical protein